MIGTPGKCSRCHAPVLAVPSRYGRAIVVDALPVAIGYADVVVRDGYAEVAGPDLIRQERVAGEDVWRKHGHAGPGRKAA
jgi:hypothetical protein